MSNIKVLFTDNHSMDRAYLLWREGLWPSHQLWGVTDLVKYGINIQILPFSNKNGLENKIPRYGHLLGDLRQQIRLFNREGFDLIYSASDHVVDFLAYLRAMGLFRKPIITIAHHPVSANCRSERLSLNGYIKGMDRIICLSTAVQNSFLNFTNLSKEKVPVVEWGVDTNFYDFAENQGEFIISVGQTARDFNTLWKAATRINARFEIFCNREMLPSQRPPENVNLTYATDGSKDILTFKQLTHKYARSKFVVIPLQPWNQLLGLNALLDAMATGKAVIMTRNPYVSIDIENEGCGIWVAPRDIDGLVNAIQRLLANPEEAAMMGKKGRNLCEKKYNIKRFARDLAEIMFQIV